MAQPLELLAATAWFWIFSAGFIASIVSSLVLLFCPALWWVVVLYFFWIWYDRNISEQGGRPLQWVRKLSWWRLMKNYFSHKLITGDITLDPSKNYIFACFPHGIFPIGPFASFVDGYQAQFPNHRAFQTALGIQFWMPVIRELFLSVGAVSVSGPSLKYLLRNAKGGNIVSVLIGGGDEAKYSRPGKYKIILNKRKGFVKMALQTGSPLVPVISFGETDAFDQLSFPGLQFLKEIVKKVLQVSLVIPFGTYVVCPNQVPVVTVVGQPIDGGKLENPTGEEIDGLHERFVAGIQNLFEEHKHKYVRDPASTILEIV